MEGAEEAEAVVVEDLSNSDVTTKYQEAAKIANLALQGVLQQCVAGARINDLCKFGDTVVEQLRTCTYCYSAAAAYLLVVVFGLMGSHICRWVQLYIRDV